MSRRKEGREPDIVVRDWGSWRDDVYFGLIVFFCLAGYGALLHYPTNLLAAVSLFVALFLGLFHWLRGGSYWLDDEQVIYRSPGRHDVIKLKGLSILLGVGENSQARYIEWKWPGGSRWLLLPEDRGSAWINTFAFLCNLQRKGASIDGLGFGRQTVAAGSSAKVSVGGQSWNLLFITFTLLLMPVWRLTGQDLLPGLVISGPLMLAMVARWLPALPFQGQLTWNAESVSVKKVWRPLWKHPLTDFRALVIERKKVWTGFERARLSLVTHYGRSIPVTAWTKCLGKAELTIIELARGSGLEIRIEGMTDSIQGDFPEIERSESSSNAWQSDDDAPTEVEVEQR